MTNFNKSPLYWASLSSTELFHSNMWAWLMKDVDDQFVEIFGVKPKGNVAGIEREENHMDITIHLKGGKCVVVENKIKSIPTYDQLDRYTKKLDKKFNSGILTGIYPTLDLSNIKGWNYLCYDEIARKIDTIHKDLKSRGKIVPNSFESIFIDNYVDLIKKISSTFNAEILNTKDVYIYKCPNNICYEDVFLKINASLFANYINDQISKNPDLKSTNTTPAAYVDFSNKKAVITVVYICKGADDKELSRIGVQIEGNEFRIYGGVEQSKKENRVFNYFIKNGYLDNEFIPKKNRGKSKSNQNVFGKQTKMVGGNVGNKKGVLAYNKYSTNRYSHIYQYWNVDNKNNIPNLKYDTIWSEIRPVLEKAKTIFNDDFHKKI